MNKAWLWIVVLIVLVPLALGIVRQDSLREMAWTVGSILLVLGIILLARRFIKPYQGVHLWLVVGVFALSVLIFTFNRNDLSSLGLLLMSGGLALRIAQVRQHGHEGWRKLRVVLPLVIMWLGAALIVFDSARNSIPSLRTVDIPLFPDVELLVPGLSTVPILSGDERAAPGHTFLVVAVRVKGKWGAREVALNPNSFHLVANDLTYETATVMYGLASHCSHEITVPMNGVASCSLVFEIPASIDTGSLQVEYFDMFDATNIVF